MATRSSKQRSRRSFDPALRAEQILDYVLTEDPELNPEEARRVARRIAVAEARRARPVIDMDTGRTASRVCFITCDESVLQSGSRTATWYTRLAEYFDEVHVIVLISRRGEEEVERISRNVWAYEARSRVWWWTPFAAWRVAKRSLTFNRSVRPDIIVAENPFEEGVAAYLISRAFDRPVQIHVTRDFTGEEFQTHDPHARWRRRIASMILRFATSVRTTTETLCDYLSSRYDSIEDCTLIPRYYDFAEYLTAKPTRDVHDTYPDFSFICLTFAELRADSALHDVMTALFKTLRNPRIGLIILGQGPAITHFRERARLLGIERSVVFLQQWDNDFDYISTSDLLIEPGVAREDDERVVKAAAAGLPIVAYRTALRGDLFVDGESAFLCTECDSQCLGAKAVKFINTPALHKQFKRIAHDIVKDRIATNSDQYYRAYRDTVESILVYEEKEMDERSKGATELAPQLELTRVVEDGVSYPIETSDARS